MKLLLIFPESREPLAYQKKNMKVAITYHIFVQWTHEIYKFIEKYS